MLHYRPSRTVTFLFSGSDNTIAIFSFVIIPNNACINADNNNDCTGRSDMDGVSDDPTFARVIVEIKPFDCRGLNKSKSSPDLREAAYTSLRRIQICSLSEF